MTVPITPGLPAPPPSAAATTQTTPVPQLAPPVQQSVQFPLTWLLDHAIPPIRYRASIEIARLALRDPNQFAILPYSYEPALLLALLQAPDGTWGNAMLTVPTPRADRFQGVGTIPAVRRLLEYGWDRESPPLVQARRVLFRLLAEDDDPSYLFELAPRPKGDTDLVRHARGVLREAAAATLAQAGYESDPRLRGAARRIVDRVDSYLRSPLAQKPFVRVGNHHVLAPEASPPSIFLLAMLAYMPHFRSEHYDIMERLGTHLSQPQPRQTAATAIGKRIIEEPHLILGDPLPHRNAADADIPAALYWLELFARLGLLRRNEGWARLYDRFLDDRDGLGVWRAPKRTVALRTANPFVWPNFPLAPQASGDELSTEITFRLGVIARYSGRQIDLT